MKRKAINICSLLVLGILMTVFAIGQNITSTLVGQVNDPSGSGVPNAHITVTNTDTGISTVGVTSSTGSYSVSDLPAGMYAVSVETTGFSTYKEHGIALQSAQTVRVDIPLKVGSIAQTVEVTGAAPLIQTDSGSIGTTLNTEQIRNLPSSYQNISDLFAAVPGSSAQGPVSNPQFAGTTHWGATNFTSNGVSMNDANNGGGAYAYSTGGPSDPTNLVNLPALDTLQEFHVLDVNGNAENRNVSSVTMVTKQGTNQFHGDLYEFLQNAYLNANTFQLKSTGQPRPQTNLNQFGGTIGGPIFKNKAFFFFAPVYLRKLTSGLSELALPSGAMTKGDFSALKTQGVQLYNPFTGQPFVNNQIPTNMIAPQAQALLKYLPAPTLAGSTGLPNGGANYFKSVPLHQSTNGYTVRLDYQVAPSDRLFGVYTYNVGSPWNVFLGGAPQWGNASDYGFADQSASLAETHTFTATMLNDFRAAWFVHNSYRQGDNPDFNPASLFPQLTPGINRGLPTITVPGYHPLFTDVGNAANKRTSVYDVQFTDNFTKVLGNHSLKAGIDETGYKSFSKLDTGSLGAFSFSGVWTGNKGWPGQPQSQGNSFADFLLGVANSATRSSITPDSEKYNRDYEVYVQDTWQATHRLTLNYGLRYMYQTPWNIKGNARSLYDLANNKIALPQNSATPTAPALGNPVFFNAYLPYFETTQSIGLSTNYIQPSKNNWSPRFGFAYRPFAKTVIRGGYGIYYNFTIEPFGAWDGGNLPFGGTTETASSKLPGAPTSPYQPDITFASPFVNPTASLSLNPTLYYVQPNLRNAMIQQFNLTVEHQFFQNWMGRASYVGSLTNHLPWYQEDLNQPLVQIPNKSYQLQRPRQPWSTISSIQSGGNQKFNQLQLEAIRRYSNGMSFQAEYSWTRSLDDIENSGGPQRYYFPNLDYGNSTGIRTHTLIANYLYALPFGPEKKWLNHSPTIVNILAGGWRLSGITTYATGTPFSVAFSVPTNYIGWVGGRADRLPGVPLYNKHFSHNVISGVQWFNPAAFGPPKPWTWGDSARNLLWTPGFWNWNLSAQKDIPSFRDNIKTTLRADFFDAFNHFNLGAPNATVASPQYGGVAIPSAGKIFGGSGSRTVEVSLRMTF